MSAIVQKIKDAFATIGDQYYIEVAYVETPVGSSVPVLLEKDYLVFDGKNWETDFSKDPNKATPFDYAMGVLIQNKLKTQFLGDPNIQVSMITVADAHFVDDVLGGIKSAMDASLSPDEQIKFKEAQDKSVELHDKISRLEGLISVGPIVTLGTGKKVPAIEINVANIESKSKLFTLKSDDEPLPFIVQNSTTGENFYKGIPVNIIMMPLKKSE